MAPPERSLPWPRSMNSQHTVENHRARISPPPTKRQRTAPRRTDLLARSASRLDEVPRRHSNQSVSHEPAANRIWLPPHRPERCRYSPASTDTLTAHTKEIRDHGITSRNNGALYLTRPSVTGSSKKTLCRICMKGTIVKYDPIIACLGCHVEFHDSCRKPPLVDEADPQHWRCFKCLSGESKSTPKPTTSRGRFPDNTTFVKRRSLLPNHSLQPSASQILVAPEESVGSRLQSIESCRVRDFAEQQISNILNDAYDEDDKVPAYLDACAENDEKGEPNAKRLIMFSREIVSSSSSLNVKSTNLKLLDSEKQPDKSAVSRRIESCLAERTEIPNTPTQRSSQFDTRNSVLKLKDDMSEENTGSDESSVSVGAERLSNIAVTAALCSVCQKQRVLVKQGHTVTCRGCQEQSLVAESRKLEIPETPQSSLVVSTQHRAETSAPVRHLDSSCETVITPQTTPDQKPLPSFDNAVVLCQKVDGLSQVYVSKSNSVKRQNGISQGATARHTTGHQVEQIRIGQGKKQSPRQVHSVHKPPRSSASKPYEGVEPDYVSADVTYSTSSRSAGQSSLNSRAQTDPVPRSTLKFTVSKRYTMRQMGRIALVAAGGSRMTTSQIILWIAHTFPYLQVGGAWEGTIRQSLSTFAEFHAQKIPGACDNKKLYGFASADLRAQYEAEYPEFCTLPNILHTPVPYQEKMVGDEIDQSRKSAQATKGKEGASILPTSPSRRFRLISEVASVQPRMNPQAKQDVTFMPFERSTPCQSVSKRNYDIGVERTTTFRAAHTLTPRTTDDTMREAETARKIAEIKARPSRKQYFGSDYRLAHKRRHDLKDIHDERDGAWKPHHVSTEQQSKRNQNMGMTDGNDPSLKEVFSLPNNQIPMNDGQTELAFRDGTLANGRLPRPRNIYRVGRMFGGELTIRAS